MNKYFYHSEIAPLQNKRHGCDRMKRFNYILGVQLYIIKRFKPLNSPSS